MKIMTHANYLLMVGDIANSNPQYHGEEGLLRCIEDHSPFELNILITDLPIVLKCDFMLRSKDKHGQINLLKKGTIIKPLDYDETHAIFAVRHKPFIERVELEKLQNE